MKILTTKQIRDSDTYTIQNEPISSIDLMERAAVQLFHAFADIFPSKEKVIIFAGPGNNGGDGIVLARLLAENLYPVRIYIMDLGSGLSQDARSNEIRLPDLSWLSINKINEDSELPVIHSDEVIVDALFGTGLKRPIIGFPAKLISHLNSYPNDIISIDIPSGLFGDDNSDNPMTAIIEAKITLSLHSPKIAFLMPENENYVGKWIVLPIGLDKNFTDSLVGYGHVIDPDYARLVINKRRKFDHKGVYGHALLISGSKGKFGATALSAKACLRSGAGLLTCHIPNKGLSPVHSFIPEAMLNLDPEKYECTTLPEIAKYSAIGMGPGLGTGELQAKLMQDVLNTVECPLVLDADALNILASKPDFIKQLPPKTILSPHPGEYKRLFGDDANHYSRIQRMKELSHKWQLIIILKGAHTAVALPNKDIWFNNCGNPGMATAGSGDVLTGIVLSLLAQGYSPENAATLAVFLHGSAGDLATQKLAEESLIASDIIDNLGQAFIELR